MTLASKALAALALHRFGFGPRPGSIAAMAPDPRGAILEELTEAPAKALGNRSLPGSAQSARLAFDARERRKAEQIVAQRAEKEGGSPMGAGGDPKGQKPKSPTVEQQMMLEEIRARLEMAFAAPVGFVERLVWFWSNHFCVATDKVIGMAGAFEREAIRPHVLGRFADMLLAVETHPAMLLYLDNTGSIGPNSVFGINRKRGLNENLAREILELHTLGARTAYTQEDVTRFAEALTGWTMLPLADNPEHGGEFAFNPRMHEPGPQEINGRVYADRGVEQGRAILMDLARHPATGRHIATKLVRHFVADDPPPAAVERLTGVFRESDGDLLVLAKALIDLPEAWQPERRKLKRPSEWVISMARAVGVLGNPGGVAHSQALLGEPLWRPPSPAGFADDAASWIDGQGARLDVANLLVQRMPNHVRPEALLEEALGPLASVETVQSVHRAESRQQGMTILVMSPEFQRR